MAFQPITISSLRSAAGLACSALVAACLAGCADMAQQSVLTDVQASIETLGAEMAETRAAVDAAGETSTQNSETVSADIAGLSQQLEQLDEVISEACRAVAVPVPQTQALDCPDPAEPVILSQNDKLLLGEIENVTVLEPEFQIVARMDTGASSSSLHATNLVEFERDGDDWVRFDVEAQDPHITPVNVEKPVKKYVRVFQQADKEGSRRPVVELRITLGNVQGVFEFTLADRSHLEHSMILGRNFLTDMAVVDVSQRFIQPSTTSD